MKQIVYKLNNKGKGNYSGLTDDDFFISSDNTDIGNGVSSCLELITLMETKNLENNKIYSVSLQLDFRIDPVTVYLKAVDDSISNKGYGVFFNPNYGYSNKGRESRNNIFELSNAYEFGDLVIWGGMWWQCINPITTSDYTIIDEFRLDTAFWNKISPYVSETQIGGLYERLYIKSVDEVVVDLKYEMLTSRFDGTNLVQFDINFFTRNEFGQIEFKNPITYFQWGNTNRDINLELYSGGLTTFPQLCGVEGCTILNSMCDILNYTGTFFLNVVLNNNCEIYGINIEGDYCGIHNMTLKNNSRFINNNTDGLFVFSNIILENYSNIIYLEIDTTSVPEPVEYFDGLSMLYSIVCTNSSTIQFTNRLQSDGTYGYCKLSNITLNSSGYLSGQIKNAWLDNIFLINQGRFTSSIISSPSAIIKIERIFINNFVRGNTIINTNESGWSNLGLPEANISRIIGLDSNNRMTSVSSNLPNITINNTPSYTLLSSTRSGTCLRLTGTSREIIVPTSVNQNIANGTEFLFYHTTGDTLVTPQSGVTVISNIPFTSQVKELRRLRKVFSNEWILDGSGGSQDLDDVLGVGNVALDKFIKLGNTAGDYLLLEPIVLTFSNVLGGQSYIYPHTSADSIDFIHPNKPAGVETYAMLSDIPTEGIKKILSKTVIDSTPVTGTTVNVFPYSITIPANTVKVGDIVSFRGRIRKTGTNGVVSFRLGDVGEPLRAFSQTSASSQLLLEMSRDFVVKSATDTEALSVSINGFTSEGAYTEKISYNIDWTIDQDVSIGLNLQNASDSALISYYELYIS